jgi:LAO/AO transport system kinase
VFVVNKADRPGADESRRDLEQMLDLAGVKGDDRPPVRLAVGTSGEGVAEVWAAVVARLEHLRSSGLLDERRRRRAGDEITRLVAVRLMEQAQAATSGDRAAALADDVAAGKLDPWSAADELLGGG